MFTPIIVIISVIGGIAFLFILAIGWGQTQATKLLTEAIAHFRQKNFRVARQLVINATRFDGKLLKDDEVKTFYDFILAERADDSRMNLDYFVEQLKNRPRSRAQIIAQHPVSKALVIGILLCDILIKLGMIFGP